MKQEDVVACKSCPLTKNACYRKFSKKELELVSELKAGELRVDAGTNILVDGHDAAHLYTILDGWAIRLKYLPEGERQVLNFALPGDLIGLQSSLFGAMQHTVEALSDVRLCVLPRDRIFDLFAQSPSLAFDVTWLAAKEEVMLSGHLVNIGQRSAFARMANLFAHLFERAERAGLTKGNRLALPLTQCDLADALGLSPVHTNKTLRKLRATKCISFDRGNFSIEDRDLLHELGDFEPSSGDPRPFI